MSKPQMGFIHRAITQLAGAFFEYIEEAAALRRLDDYRRRFQIASTARIGRILDVRFDGNVTLGDNSYFNSGRIQSGPNSKVVIGDWCAIGYNVNILALTHDPETPTGPVNARPMKEADITIGNHVWIGSNVFVREGVTIGDHAIVGANSVVVHNIPPYAVVGGVPARLLYTKSQDLIQNQQSC